MTTGWSTELLEGNEKLVLPGLELNGFLEGGGL